MLAIMKDKGLLTFLSRILLVRCCSSKVPKHPCLRRVQNEYPKSTFKVDKETILHLERLSLVAFGNKAGGERLEAAVQFADHILSIDTTGVQPMVSVLEDNKLTLRDDLVTDGNCRKDLLSYAAVTEEEYFVAPPGNIPLEPGTLPDSTS